MGAKGSFYSLSAFNITFFLIISLSLFSLTLSVFTGCPFLGDASLVSPVKVY